MHDYNTILGVIELRLSKVSYDTVQKLPDWPEWNHIDYETL